MESPPLLGLLGLLLLLLLGDPGTGLGEHRPDYDREALLGGQDEVEEFSKLSPEEQQKRLKVIISRIDVDLDGFLTEGELSSWIQHSFKSYIIEDAKQQFQHYDKDGDGRVSWEEYNIQMYDRVIDFEEDTTLDDAEEESFRQLHLKDKKRFQKANKDGDSHLDFEEFAAFEHPEEADYMKGVSKPGNFKKRESSYSPKRLIERSNLGLRRNFLIVRTINQWNNLPPEVVAAPTLEVFKKRLDRYLSEMVYGFLPEQRVGLEDLQGPFQLYYYYYSRTSSRDL